MLFILLLDEEALWRDGRMLGEHSGDGGNEGGLPIRSQAVEVRQEVLAHLAGDAVAHQGLEIGDRLGVAVQDGLEELLPELGEGVGVVVQVDATSYEEGRIGRE